MQLECSVLAWQAQDPEFSPRTTEQIVLRSLLLLHSRPEGQQARAQVQLEVGPGHLDSLELVLLAPRFWPYCCLGFQSSLLLEAVLPGCVIPQSCGPQRPRLPAWASVQHLEDGQLWAGQHSTGVPVEQDISPEQMGSEQDNRLWVLSSTPGLPHCKPEQPQL